MFSSSSRSHYTHTIKISGNSPCGSVHMTSHHEVTLIQVSTRVLRGMLARCRAVFQSKVVVHNSSIYASQRGKQQVSHLWQTIFNSKRFFSKSRLIDPSKKVSDRERMGQGGSKEEDRGQ